MQPPELAEFPFLFFGEGTILSCRQKIRMEDKFGIEGVTFICDITWDLRQKYPGLVRDFEEAGLIPLWFPNYCFIVASDDPVKGRILILRDPEGEPTPISKYYDELILQNIDLQKRLKILHIGKATLARELKVESEMNIDRYEERRRLMKIRPREEEEEERLEEKYKKV